MSAPVVHIGGPTLTDLGEDRVIAALTRSLPLSEDVRAGVGDDCAVIGRPRDARWQLLKTDVVIEGVHFLPDEDPRRVGWKALARAVSDIAAMGGMPSHALITLGARSETVVSWVKDLYSGLRKGARKFGVSIVGGETSHSPGPLFVNVALTGWVERTKCVFRSGGKPGDALYVTGRLGGSLRGRHLAFTPRVSEARWLAAHFAIHAMMDLSDGLAADLPRLAAASHCEFEILEDSIPCSAGCTAAQALTDGEDYELLFAVSSRDIPRLESEWRKQFPRLLLSRIGSLKPRSKHARKSSQPLRKASGSISPLPGGYDHFSKR